MSTSELPATGAVRPFKIYGDVGSQLNMRIVNSSGVFYNFKSTTFAQGVSSDGSGVTTFNLDNVLDITLTSRSYSGFIKFPASFSGSYNIILTAKSGTKILDSVTGEYKGTTTTMIQGLADTTLDFALASLSYSSSYETFPANKQSSGSPAGGSAQLSNEAWDIENKNNDANGYGLTLTGGTIKGSIASLGGSAANAWYYTTTDTVDNPSGATSLKEIKVDDLTNIAVGMTIIAVSSGSLSGTPTIEEIDVENNLLKLSSEQTFADGITLTFKAVGNIINDAIGSSIKFTNVTAVTQKFTTRVRGAVSSSANITVQATHGIAATRAAAKVTMSGPHGTTPVVSITTADWDGSGTDGVIVTTPAQTFADGDVLDITGSSKTASVTFSLSINQYPTANQTIYLDLDSIITPGVATAE
tara:strand:+ start:205 stop:1449 length:1245 start_codon:yes stop_codon:yes gene_type:complete